MNSICAIGVFYGKFNNYFPLWLKSCAYNPNIDFFIVTDIIYNDALPKNVQFINLSLTQVRNLASEKLGVEVQLYRAYKCCDLRPFYGVVFEDYIKEYEYWGLFDFDMLFGDIYCFLKKYEYKSYDKFLPLGHLSFFKNTQTVNHYYKLDGSLCGDYHEVLINERNYLFDENFGINAILLKNKIPFFKQRIFADITPLYKRYIISTGSSLDEKVHKNYDNQIFYWEKGKIYRAYYENGTIKNDEFIYLHQRSRPNYRIPFDVEKVDSFYITNKGFVEKEGEVSLEIIRKYNNNPGTWVENAQKTNFFVKLYFHKLLRKLGLRSRL